MPGKVFFFPAFSYLVVQMETKGYRIMRDVVWLLSVMLMVSCGSVSHPENAVNRLQNRPGVSKAQIDSIAQTLSYFPEGTQFAISLVDDSSAVFYGASREDDTLKTVDNRTNVFEIGSLSKVFTSALLADLVLEGRVSLDQPVQAFLDIRLNGSLQITFRELSNHTSGLPRIPSGFVWESIWHMDNPYKDYDEEKLRQYLLNDIALEGEQGESYQYSNIGAGLLGYVLTRVTGQSYEEMLQQRIFEPLDMNHSTTIRSHVADLLVKGLDKRGNPTANWDLGAIPGAGAILSTTEDLAKFAQANIDSSYRMLALQHQKTYRIDENRSIGLGWFIIKDDSTQKWLWHNGGTGGYRSSMVMDIRLNKSAIILSNISAGHSQSSKIDDLSYFLLKQIN